MYNDGSFGQIGCLYINPHIFYYISIIILIYLYIICKFNCDWGLGFESGLREKYAIALCLKIFNGNPVGGISTLLSWMITFILGFVGHPFHRSMRVTVNRVHLSLGTHFSTIICSSFMARYQDISRWLRYRTSTYRMCSDYIFRYIVYFFNILYK